MNNNDKPNTENTSQPENTYHPEKEPQPEKEHQPENTSSPSPQPEKEPQPEKVSQTQLEESPLIRGMDTANSLAAKVLFTRSKEEFVDHVFTDQNTGNKLSYAEMRMRYG